MFFHPQPILRNTHFIDKGLEYFEKYFLNYSKHFLRDLPTLRRFCIGKIKIPFHLRR